MYNYIALGSGQQGAALIGRGQFTVTNLQNGRIVHGVIFADARGDNDKDIEISEALARNLGILFSRTRFVYGYIDRNGQNKECPVTIGAHFDGNLYMSDGKVLDTNGLDLRDLR